MKQHVRLAFKVKEEMEQDTIIRDLLSVLLMFKPKETSKFPEHIRHQYHTYLLLLRRYLVVKYQNNRIVQQKYFKFMQIIEDVWTVKQNALRVVSRGVEPSKVSDVLAEIYYLREGPAGAAPAGQQGQHGSSSSSIQGISPTSSSAPSSPPITAPMLHGHHHQLHHPHSSTQFSSPSFSLGPTHPVPPSSTLPSTLLSSSSAPAFSHHYPMMMPAAASSHLNLKHRSPPTATTTAGMYVPTTT